MKDPILFWNEVALEVHRRDFSFANGQQPQQGGPTRTSRALAIVHLAMYDAWNGAKMTGKNYLNSRSGESRLPVPPTMASAEAAVGSAAATALTALFSNQMPYIEQSMQSFCANELPAGQTVQQINDGVTFGRDVAEALLDYRKNDGSDASDQYIAGDGPGAHRPDPYNPTQGYLGPRWGSVTPFCVASPAGASNLAVYLGPPPAFNSTKYKDHFEEVRDYGGKVRGKRSIAQEITGLFWAYDGAKDVGTPPRLYNQIVAKIAVAKNNDPDKNARLFALINAGMADAGIVAWQAKYVYNLWRPVIGIREDDAGTGPTGLGTGSEADGDPFWQPYGAPKSNEPGKRNFTPPFPAYPSGHATFGTTVFELVGRFYNVLAEDLSFEFVSDELNGVTLDADGSVRTYVERPYTLREAIDDNLQSRVWLGVHWRFDGEAGKQAGVEVARQVFTSPHLT